MTRERQATNDQQTSLNVLALWPEPVMRATLVSSDSFSTIPASAETRGAASKKESRRKEAASDVVRIRQRSGVGGDIGTRRPRHKNTSAKFVWYSPSTYVPPWNCVRREYATASNYSVPFCSM